MSRFPIPQDGDGARLPAVLAAVLALMLVLQFALTSTPMPAPTTGIAHIPAAGVTQVPDVMVPTIILSRPLFAPTRATGSGPSAPAIALGGATVAGSVTIRGHQFIVLQLPGGGTRNLGLGGSFASWRLVAVRNDAALFQKGGERLTMPYGAASAASAAAEPQSEEQ